VRLPPPPVASAADNPNQMSAQPLQDVAPGPRAPSGSFTTTEAMRWQRHRQKADRNTRGIAITSAMASIDRSRLPGLRAGRRRGLRPLTAQAAGKPLRAHALLGEWVKSAWAVRPWTARPGADCLVMSVARYWVILFEDQFGGWLGAVGQRQGERRVGGTNLVRLARFAGLDGSRWRTGQGPSPRRTGSRWPRTVLPLKRSARSRWRRWSVPGPGRGCSCRRRARAAFPWCSGGQPRAPGWLMAGAGFPGDGLITRRRLPGLRSRATA
jgi:hypothetical protein